MVRIALIAAAVLCFNACAHLNHIQFAAIDESGGMLHVRYRMSADMFMSNLDADIKNGRLPEAVKQQPLSGIIREYFKSHLVLEIDGVKNEAASAAFEFDAKTSDWIADFTFPAPPAASKATLLCDAFLENNPRTQTLARINWRGENTMFHFRAEHVRYALGASLQAPTETQATSVSVRDQFLDGLARALTAYDFLAAGALGLLVLGQILSKRTRRLMPIFVLALAVLLASNQCGRNDAALVAGYALGWCAVVVTIYVIVNRFFLAEEIVAKHPETV